MNIMVNNMTKIISYEINESRIRKLVKESDIADLLDYNPRVVYSSTLNTTYVLWILTPKNIKHLSSETINKIKTLLSLLTDLCAPTGLTKKLTEEMLDFMYACGGHKFLKENDIIRISRSYVLKIQEYPWDIITEAFSNYETNYSGFPPINVILEMMEKLYAKRRSLFDSLQKIIINLEKNDGGEFAFA